jgi:hypothetical protein
VKRREGQVRKDIELSSRGTLTLCQVEEERLRTRKESEEMRGTHELSSTGGRITQDTKRKRAGKEHSLAIEEGQIRTPKAVD